MYWLIALFILFLIYYGIWSKKEEPNRWACSFAGLHFSSDDFYKAAEEAIKKREISAIFVYRTNYFEGGPMSAMREYLHVEWNEYMFDICAAPFGTDFFVSEWFVERRPVWRKLLYRFEHIEWVMKLARFKTYYHIDTASMFKGSVHAAILEAIDEMTESKGIRKLSETERRLADVVGK